MLLKDYRKKKSLTQSDVAKKIGVSLRQYQRFEAGTASPKGLVLNRLEDLFETPQRVLLAKSAEEIPEFYKQYK